MGFLNEFAYGFAQTARPILEAQGKAQAEADAKIREQVASVDPLSELYRRQKDIDEAEAVKLKREIAAQRANDLPSFMSNTQAAPSQATDTSTSGGAAPTIPNPTINTSTGGGMMSPVTPQPFMSAPAAPTDHFTQQQAYTVAKAKALDRGDKEGAELYQTMADYHKNALEQNRSQTKLGNEPTKSAEGVNIVEDIKKDVDTNNKAAGKTMYQPDKLQSFTSDTDVAKNESDVAETIHAPLTQAVLDAKVKAGASAKQVAGVIKKETLQPTKDIVTIQSDDARITPEDKQKALKDLSTYMTKTFGNKAGAMVAQDPNLSAVFNENLVKRITDLQSGKVEEPKINNTPVSTPQDGATATNPKTGEKVVYDGGQWRPVTPQATQ